MTAKRCQGKEKLDSDAYWNRIFGWKNWIFNSNKFDQRLPFNHSKGIFVQKMYCEAHLDLQVFIRPLQLTSQKKVWHSMKDIFIFVCVLFSPRWLDVQSQLRTPQKIVSILLAWFLLRNIRLSVLRRARDIRAPDKRPFPKAFMFHSKEPQFPAGVLLRVRLGLAFGSGCEDFVGVRQGGTLLAVLGAKSLHQRLQLVLLQLKVQLHAAMKAERERD